MSTLETIVKELSNLPAYKLASVPTHVHGVRELSLKEKLAVLEATGGSLTTEEADELERAIKEGSERIDPIE